jgi:hypothetical protein
MLPSSDTAVVTEGLSGGSNVTQEMPQTNPANSRAIAVITLMTHLIFNCNNSAT